MTDYYAHTLTAEQAEAAERMSARLPSNAYVEKRGQSRRWEGTLNNMSFPVSSFPVIVAERGFRDKGLMLISLEPLPALNEAMLFFRDELGHPIKLTGQTGRCRKGQRPEDSQSAVQRFFTVFTPE